MTYVVTEKCIKCKYTTCVEVCPVDCFYEGELMVAIDPDECIDCGVCVEECPIDAIVEEREDLVDWIETTRSFVSVWPSITKKKEPLENASHFQDEEGKYEKYMKKSLS